MKLTKREKFMLFQALEFEIHRYLMSNTFGREDGNEKAIGTNKEFIDFVKRSINWRLNN